MQDRRYCKGGNPVHAQACEIIAVGGSLVIEETQCRTGGTVRVEILSMHKHVI